MAPQKKDFENETACKKDKDTNDFKDGDDLKNGDNLRHGIHHSSLAALAEIF